MTRSLRSKIAPAAALGLVLVGPPVLLWTLVGWPLPAASALSEAINLRWVSPALAQQLGATVAWAAWLYIAVCITTSVLGQARHTTVNLPLPHSFAGWINATVALVLVGSSVSGRHAAAPITPPVASVAYQAATVPQQAAVLAPTAYQVQPRDTLWDIAEDHLGNPLRWREIWQLNAHQRMSDGTTFEDLNLIRPGWQLTMPGSRAHPADHVRPAHPVPRPTHHQQVAPETLADAPPPAPAALPPPSRGAEAQPDRQPATANTSGERTTSANEYGSTLPVGLGLGAAAVGIMATLARRRRRAMRQRPVGMRLALPTGDLAAAEHALSNRSNLDRAHAIAGTLRLAAALTPHDDAPVLELLIDNHNGIELQFTGATALPEPFVATEAGYRLPREHLPATYAAADRADPAPALVHLGDDDRGAIYLNLEAPGAVALDGDPDARDDLIRRILTSLAGSPWTALTEVRVTSDEQATSDLLGRAECVTLAEELPRLANLAGHTKAEVLRSGSSSLLALRWAGSEAPDGVSFVVANPQEAGIAELIGLAQDGLTAVVALLTGPHPDVPTIKLSDEAMLLPDHSVVTTPVTSPGSREAVRELLDLTDAPYVEVTSEPYVEVHQQAPPSDEEAEVVVRVLGPLEIDGPIPHLSPQMRDIVLYLALHRRGVSLGEMATALWPEALRSEKTLRNRMHELRRSLGGRISLGPGWRVDETITTDWAQFQALATGSLADRQKALDLVRGQPLADVKGDWSSMEGFQAEMEAAVVD
nr:LysM peptidoglycan-binding domain-containing protein [Actinomycetota bacterium]